jgi:hypothetical protein
MQRNKGKRFERAIATVLRSYFPDAIVRRASQADRAHQSDVYIAGGPPLLSRLWLECQDAATPTPIAKLEQAERDVTNGIMHWDVRRSRIPVVIWHKLGARDIHATMRLWALDTIRRPHGNNSANPVVVTMNLDGLMALIVDAVTEQTKEAA